MKQAPPAKQQLTTVVALFLMLHAWTTFSQAQAGDLYWTEALLVPQLQTSDADGNNVTPIVTSGLGTPLHTDVPVPSRRCDGTFYDVDDSRRATAIPPNGKSTTCNWNRGATNFDVTLARTHGRIWTPSVRTSSGRDTVDGATL